MNAEDREEGFAESGSRRRHDRAVGWLLVAAQFGLLAVLVLLPRGVNWTTPAPISAVGVVLILSGAIVAGIAAMGLGAGLTPHPVPVASAQLRTGGMYARVRHPIYAGLIAIVAGIAMGSGSIPVVVTAAATVAFLHIKARWEERRLAERFEEYPAYVAVTGRFLPRFRRGARRP